MGETLFELKWAIVSIGMVLGFAFVMNYSGMSSTMALVLAKYRFPIPVLSPFLGWLGVFLNRFRYFIKCTFLRITTTNCSTIGT